MDDSLEQKIRDLEGQLGDVRGATVGLARRVDAEVAEVRALEFRRPGDDWTADAWDAAELPADGVADGRTVIDALTRCVACPEGMSWIEFLRDVIRASMVVG
jgi:hypothetical protein